MGCIHLRRLDSCVSCSDCNCELIPRCCYVKHALAHSTNQLPTFATQLDNVKKELMAFNFDKIVSFLRRAVVSINCNAVMDFALRIPLDESHIKSAALEFRTLRESGELAVERVPRSRFRTSDSLDLTSLATSRATSITSRVTLQNIMKVHRFYPNLKRSTREITVKDLTDQIGTVIGRPKFVVLLSNVLSPEECAGLIKRAKGEQFEDIDIKRSVGLDEKVHVASCRRSLAEDAVLAWELFERVSTALRGTDLEEKLQHAPWVSNGSSALNNFGLNERINFLRYGVNQFFSPHRDSRSSRGSQMSHITVQIFLNDNFTGGAVSFRRDERFLDVKPQMGAALLFDQDLRREECEVISGQKFVARADVMFDTSPCPLTPIASSTSARTP